MSVYVSEEHVSHRDDGTSCGLGGTNEPQEAFTDDTGKLFRSLQGEYGRCVSKVYVDLPDGKHKAIGWVFQKRREFEDNPRRGSKETYLHEVWVTLHDEPPTVTTEYHYHEVGG